MQYGAELSHARLCRARANGCNASSRGDASCGPAEAEAAALASERRASQIRAEYAQRWVGSGAGYIRGFLQNGSRLGGWGQMENVIPLVVGLAPAQTAATDASLEQLVRHAEHALTEIRTQMPEAFWRYGRPDDALHIMRGFRADPRKTYPEVSFTFVENCVVGLLGLAPDAAAHAIRTRHRLGTGMGWAAAENILVGAHTIAVRHDLGGGGGASAGGAGAVRRLRTTVSHTAHTAPPPTGGPNGGAWGYDHADSRSSAAPMPPGPPPEGNIYRIGPKFAS